MCRVAEALVLCRRSPRPQGGKVVEGSCVGWQRCNRTAAHLPMKLKWANGVASGGRGPSVMQAIAEAPGW